MKLLAIDGNSILNRAFYGIKLLTTKQGRYTNAVVGFMNIFLKLLHEIEPEQVAVAFDMRGPTFRHALYTEYKAGRKGMPPELAEQLPVVKELLTLLGYRIVETEGYEADDILGTLAQAACREGIPCRIATGDRDSLQLVSDCVYVYLATTKMGRPLTTIYNEQQLLEEYGLSPAQMIDLKALMGDASDHIPGVPGIGQKTATDLLTRFGTLEQIYAEVEHLDVSGSVRNKLIAGKELAYLSRTLGTIAKDVPIDTELNAYSRGVCDTQGATRLLSELEMFAMLEKLELPAQDVPPTAIDDAPAPKITLEASPDLAALYTKLQAEGRAHFLSELENGVLQTLYITHPESVYKIEHTHPAFTDFLQKLFTSADILCCTYDVKPLYRYCMQEGLPYRPFHFDALLAAYLLNPSATSYELPRLLQEYFVAPGQLEGETSDRDWVIAAAALPLLCEKLQAQIEANEQEKLLYDIEMPLAEVLASMETVGFLVDVKGISDFGRDLETQIDAFTRQIYELAGRPFNINSPKQLGEVLFNDLQLPAKKKTKSGYSTNVEVLESLMEVHPIIPMILEYRQLVKLKTTYCDGLVKVVGADGRIHSTLNQTETRTGRISSTEPNLQNIPTRQELGRELRRYFIAKEGCLLVDADYSQIELRVLADISNDKTMIEAFNANEDIHRITASQVFNMPLSMVTPLMRSRAKAVNFGIVYGIGAFSLAKDIGVTRAEADQYIKGYFSHYAGVQQYMDRVVQEAKECGYAQTLFGRRRYLPELASKNAVQRAFGERVARNMPIQGAAADIIKIAMIRVYRRLQAESLATRLILQVHDELILEAPEAEAELAARIVDEEMENACQMQVRLIADVHTGKTWYDTK